MGVVTVNQRKRFAKAVIRATPGAPALPPANGGAVYQQDNA